MKCKECDACHLTFYTRWNKEKLCMNTVEVYECRGVKEPFEITDINRECTEYPEKRDMKVECGVCSADYDQQIYSYLYRYHYGDEYTIDKIDTHFCPNCGRKLTDCGVQMVKLFATSDIHSHFNIFINELKAKGFDEYNPDHWLVVCGDCFDRGGESEDLLHYLMTLERKIIVKGNHDILLEECCARGFPYSHDYSNGTVKTINDIGGAGEGRSFDECCIRTWNKLARYRELLVNYFETQNYIFVHSWIPTCKKEIQHPADKWIPLTTNEYMEDWRNANDVEWEDAMWGNPFKMADQDLNKTRKTIVFGHFHTSYAHSRREGTSEFSEDANFDIYYGEDYIGIDACTAYTGKVNVLVLEDEFINE